jgi:hypothetical protein
MNVTELIEILKDEHPDREVLIDASRINTGVKELRPVYDVVLLRIDSGERFLVLSHAIEEGKTLEEED